MKEEAYNEWLHLQLERWKPTPRGKKPRPRKIYAIRKMRRLRRLAKMGAIPIEHPITQGVAVSKLEHGKQTSLLTYIGRTD